MEISDHFDVRRLTPEHLADAVLLSQEARWNQNENDWRLMTTLGEATGVWTAEGRLVASALTLPYGGPFGWISMVLVTRDFRHRGIASALLKRCTEILRNKGLVPGLDATEDGHPVYVPLGFTDIYRLSRLTTEKVPPNPEPPPEIGVEIRVLEAGDMGALQRYDRPLFGADRTAILSNLYERQPTRAYLALRLGEIAGYVLGREGREADQVGPLVADTPQIALALAHRALAGLPRWVYMDVGDHHPELMDWLSALGLTRQRPYTRMLLGASRPFDDPEKIYAIAGPELG